MKLGVLKAYADYHHNYINACKALNVGYELIDILDPEWLNKVKNSDCDGFLCHPPDDIQETKSIYDEKLYIISQVLKRPIYPNFNSLYIYENKRNMIGWMQANDIPHPESKIFARKSDAISYFGNAEFPLVLKTNVGAAATGVDIIKSAARAKRIARCVFGHFHPAMTFGRLKFGGRLMVPMPLFGRIQKHYLIVQKYYKIKWEWRILKIGNTYAGHQKLLKKGFASGSDKIGWAEPPLKLFDLAREICVKGDFDSMDVDIFETIEGKFLVNELQTMFGSYSVYQMKKDGKPGIYRYKDGEYKFIEGEYHQFGSNILRVKNFVEILKNRWGK